MKITVIGKPEDYIKKSRPEDILKYAQEEKTANETKEKNTMEIEIVER